MNDYEIIDRLRYPSEIHRDGQRIGYIWPDRVHSGNGYYVRSVWMATKDRHPATTRRRIFHSKEDAITYVIGKEEA